MACKCQGVDFQIREIIERAWYWCCRIGSCFASPCQVLWLLPFVFHTPILILRAKSTVDSAWKSPVTSCLPTTVMVTGKLMVVSQGSSYPENSFQGRNSTPHTPTLLCILFGTLVECILPPFAELQGLLFYSFALFHEIHIYRKLVLLN